MYDDDNLVVLLFLNILSCVINKLKLFLLYLCYNLNNNEYENRILINTHVNLVN